MPNPSSMFTSIPFKFIVEGQIFYIHGAVVSLISKPLGRLIEGSMSEAINGSAHIEDVTAATFTRFSNYAYKCKYTAADVKKSNALIEAEIPSNTNTERVRLRPHPSFATSFVEEDEDAGEERASKRARADSDGTFTRIESSDRPSRKLMQDQFKTLGHYYTSFRKLQSRSSGTISQDANKDYTELFLCHAQLCVFAEKYDVQGLKKLAILNLYTVLQNFSLYPQRIGDVVALLRYVYGNTPDLENSVDELRQLMKFYVGFQMDHLLESDEFKDLLNEGGALLHDFCGWSRRESAKASPLFPLISSGSVAQQGPSTRVFLSTDDPHEMGNGEINSFLILVL